MTFDEFDALCQEHFLAYTLECTFSQGIHTGYTLQVERGRRTYGDALPFSCTIGALTASNAFAIARNHILLRFAPKENTDQ